MSKLYKLTVFSALLFIIIALASCATMRGTYSYGFSYNRYINGYWGGWNNAYYNIEFYNSTTDAPYLIIYPPSFHPSTYITKITCYKSTQKKNGKWYEYNGEIECGSAYEINSRDYVSIWPLHLSQDVKTVHRAKISVFNSTIDNAYKGYTINVYFDNVGIGISPK